MKNAGPGVYRHYKGGLYRVLCECVMSTNGPDDGKRGVVYVSMTNGHVFVRTYEQFHEFVIIEDLEGYVMSKPRFERVAENSELP